MRARHASRRQVLVRFATVLLATGGAIAFAPAPPTHAQGVQQTISDREFWDIFTTMSEEGGSFVSENFTSNEMTFQYVIPHLQKTLTPNGVYLGVGPEQNFTYIANLKPQMAIIFDIRRQNALLHLAYKAMFELSSTRAEFVSRLFSRPAVAKLGANIPVAALFDSAAVAAPNDSAYAANRDAIIRQLVQTHGFSLSAEDIAIIERVYGIFYRAGTDINYGYRPTQSFITSRYPAYGVLQSATNADSVPMAFLGTEANYHAVRDMHLRNLIIPVVGDFGGTKAIRSVGDYLRKRELKVAAFYLSNVEQYLFRNRAAADQFYTNVSMLPVDATSSFIRSVPQYGSMLGGPGMFVTSGTLAASGSFSMTIVDSGGVRVTRIVQDSAGVPVTRTLVDSAGRTADRLRLDSALTRQDSAIANLIRALTDSSRGFFLPTRPVMVNAPTFNVGASLLTSGVATIRESLDAFFDGRLRTYQDVITMTRTSGWK